MPRKDLCVGATLATTKGKATIQKIGLLHYSQNSPYRWAVAELAIAGHDGLAYCAVREDEITEPTPEAP